MTNKVIIKIEITDDKNIKISNNDHQIIIDKNIKTINAQNIYDLLDYSIDNEYLQPFEKIEGESEETADTIRLFNYTIDLMNKVITGINEKSIKLREEKNLTQQQLAEKLYVSRQTICRWENGSRCPDLITAKKLALELKVSMDELISDEACRIFRLIMESGN